MSELNDAFLSFRNIVDRLSKPGVTNQVISQARNLQADKRARGMTLERLAMSMELCVRMKALLDTQLMRMLVDRSETSGLEMRSVTLSQARLDCADTAITWAKDPPTELRIEYESWAKNAVVICDIPLLAIKEDDSGFILSNAEKRMSQLKVEQFFEIIENLGRRERTNNGGGF
jgi:hypothetical protein